jgi:hypothetical protein
MPGLVCDARTAWAPSGIRSTAESQAITLISLYAHIPLGPVIFVQLILVDFKRLGRIRKTGLLRQAFLRGNCIGIRRVNTDQLFIFVVNVPEQVNGCHGRLPRRTE